MAKPKTTSQPAVKLPTAEQLAKKLIGPNKRVRIEHQKVFAQFIRSGVRYRAHIRRLQPRQQEAFNGHKLTKEECIKHFLEAVK